MNVQHSSRLSWTEGVTGRRSSVLFPSLSVGSLQVLPCVSCFLPESKRIPISCSMFSPNHSDLVSYFFHLAVSSDCGSADSYLLNLQKKNRSSSSLLMHKLSSRFKPRSSSPLSLGRGREVPGAQERGVNADLSGWLFSLNTLFDASERPLHSLHNMRAPI